MQNELLCWSSKKNVDSNSHRDSKSCSKIWKCQMSWVLNSGLNQLVNLSQWSSMWRFSHLVIGQTMVKINKLNLVRCRLRSLLPWLALHSSTSQNITKEDSWIGNWVWALQRYVEISVKSKGMSSKLRATKCSYCSSSTIMRFWLINKSFSSHRFQFKNCTCTSYLWSRLKYSWKILQLIHSQLKTKWVST